MAAGADGAIHVLYYDAEAQPHYDIARPDGSLAHDRPFDRGQGRMSLVLGADGRPFISHFDGQTFILSRQGITFHDEAVYGLVVLK